MIKDETRLVEASIIWKPTDYQLMTQYLWVTANVSGLPVYQQMSGPRSPVPLDICLQSNYKCWQKKSLSCHIIVNDFWNCILSPIQLSSFSCHIDQRILKCLCVEAALLIDLSFFYTVNNLSDFSVSLLKLLLYLNQLMLSYHYVLDVFQREVIDMCWYLKLSWKSSAVK